jgi:chromosome partitioning protein
MSESDRHVHPSAAVEAEGSAGEVLHLLRSPRGTPWGTLSARVISLVSRKGGVGKTTSAVNLGAAFALSGHSVLLIGVDPQCGVSHSLGYGKYDLDSGLLDVFHAHVPLNHLAYPTSLENLRFVTPNIWNLEEEEEYKRCLVEETDVLLRAIDRARNLYDTILIDCPPGMGPETRAALLASDSYLVPVQAEELCRDSLGRLLAFVSAFRDQVYAESNLAENGASSAPLTLEGLFLTMTSTRTRLSKRVAESVAAEFGLDLFAVAVPRTTRLAEMALHGRPAVIYDRRSPGSRAYFDLLDEIIRRHAERHGTRDAAPAPALALAAAIGHAGPDDDDPDAADGDDLPPGEDLAWPDPEAVGDPDLVSLEDLLEQEMRSEGDDDWDSSGWGLDGEGRARTH